MDPQGSPQNPPPPPPNQQKQQGYSTTEAKTERLYQIHLEIFGSSNYFKNDLGNLLFASQLEERLFVSKDNPEGKKLSVLSHIPDNIKICPIADCPTEIDTLPAIIDMENPPPSSCATHTKKLVWKNWNPPCTEVGFKQVIGLIMSSASSQNIGMAYIPQDYPVVEYSVGYGEGVMEAIYKNSDTWVADKDVFMDEGYDFSLENAVITNVQAVLYKAQGKLVDKTLQTWEVHENYGAGGGPSQGAFGQSKPQGIFAGFKRWLSGN